VFTTSTVTAPSRGDAAAAVLGVVGEHSARGVSTGRPRPEWLGDHHEAGPVVEDRLDGDLGDDVGDAGQHVGGA
jgi:hypothetical protein